MKIPRVHLKRSRGVTTLKSDKGHAYPLSESDMPKHDGTIKSVHRIIDYLNVENSLRYKRTYRSTFCNIYAHDFAYLMGAFVPRVWWVDNSLNTENFELVRYGHTVRELNANSLAQWFKEYGPEFGWKKLERTTDITLEAEKGKCVIMVAANKLSSKSGHIVAAVPSIGDFKPIGSRGVFICPVQSQAGGTNRKYFARNWWRSGHKQMNAYVFEGVPHWDY